MIKRMLGREQRDRREGGHRVASGETRRHLSGRVDKTRRGRKGGKRMNYLDTLFCFASPPPAYYCYEEILTARSSPVFHHFLFFLTRIRTRTIYLYAFLYRVRSVAKFASQIMRANLCIIPKSWIIPHVIQYSTIERSRSNFHEIKHHSTLNMTFCLIAPIKMQSRISFLLCYTLL